MPLVNVMVNDRSYTIACDEGEEEHLRGLAAIVDAKAREVAGSIGQVGDTRLLLMTALLMADDRQGREAGTATQEPAGSPVPEQENTAQALELAAQRIEDIAARLSAV